MSRPDQSITFLRSFGYSVFRFPRASAQPLELMHRDGKDLTRLGTVTQLVSPGSVPVPTVRRDDRPGIDIEGRETSAINVGIGLSMLGSFIGALGGSSLGLQAGFTRARTVTFTYAGVMEDSVDVLAVEQFVKAGTLSPLIPSGTLEKLLDDEIYVVTSVLKTARIAVSAQGEAGNSIQLDVPVIQQAVGGNLKVDASGGLASKVTFEGATPIAFALQAVQLVFDESGEFLTTEQLPAGDAAARAAGRAAAASGRRGPVFLESRGAFVRVGS
ncbi:MAG TPA: hypothetical protein VF136_19615 [Methylomirabilota bacterium]